MNPLEIIEKYYAQNSRLYQILVTHSQMVANKAILIAKKYSKKKLDLKFIEEAGMLHDIGVFLTESPEIECFGDKPYIAHGYLGRELLEKEGLYKHALVCERHLGMGITKDEIIKNNFPLPLRNMLPNTIEEKIICLADKFFSKSAYKSLTYERTVDEARRKIEKFGQDKVKKFDSWIKLFNLI